jgi:glycosyltransferase involved in cell wall biosynthesis
LKILHLSDTGLPDWRVEKSAITGIKQGYSLLFAGPRDWRMHSEKTFSSTYELDWTSWSRMGIPYHWHMIKKQLKSILSETNPDIIHAHNLCSAKLASEFKVPFIYDDHEFWSLYARLLLESSAIKQDEDTNSLDRIVRHKLVKLNRHYIAFRWSRWEKTIVQNNPVITVSEAIRNQLKSLGNSYSFVVPNVPLMAEVQGIQDLKYELTPSSVYAGHDGLSTEKYPYRNMDGLVTLFQNKDIGTLTIIGWPGQSSSKIIYRGRLERNEMFSDMTKHSVGLVPFRKHWSHPYLSPNKAYEYANAGLLVVCTSSFRSVISNLNDNCEVFEDYSDLESVLMNLASDVEHLHKRRIQIMNFARKNLTWEKFEGNIIKAYGLC